MPTKKQRRTRAKTFRHQYVIAEIDAEGNEIELERTPLTPEQKAAAARQAEKQKKKGGKQSRPSLRVTTPPDAPSWRRAFRKSLLMTGAMLVIMAFLLRSQPVWLRIGWGLIYGVAFIPLTYWIDSWQYKRYQQGRPGRQRR